MPVETRTSTAPKPDEEAQAALVAKAKELAPKYRAEFLKG
jgi:hypothetical protein